MSSNNNNLMRHTDSKSVLSSTAATTGTVSHNSHASSNSYANTTTTSVTPTNNLPTRSRKYSFGSNSYNNSNATTNYSSNTKNSSSHKNNYGNYPTKIEFSPIHRNVYGVINYLHHSTISNNDNKEDGGVKSNQQQFNNSWRGKKLSSRLGPILLELAHFQPGDQSSTTTKGIDIIATSRGNPALGVNIASTCLSFRKNHSHINQYQQPSPQLDTLFHCATGTSSGALCIHSFREGTSTVQYYVPPRHHRLATDVAWRDGNYYNSSGSQYVAIGLVGASSQHATSNSSSGSGTGGGGGGISASTQYYLHHHHHSSSSSERDFCCLVWDVETQGFNGTVTGNATDGTNSLNSMTNTTHSNNMTMVGGVQVSVKTPVYRLAHNAPVASLSWVCDGQYLVIGCQSRGNLQIYDLRVSAGSNAPPMNTHAHEHSVQGIHPDPFRPTYFSTHSRNIVKLWDVRRMDSSVSEIKCPSSTVSSVAWSPSTIGSLCIATVNDKHNQHFLRYYDTESRPTLTNLIELKEPIQGLIFQPPPPPANTKTATNTNQNNTPPTFWWDKHSSEEKEEKTSSSALLYPHRFVAVQSDGTIKDMPQHQIAPLAISPRDGRVSHSLGNVIWMGTTTDGPSGMEHTEYTMDEDISTTMMRRARCLHQARYSTNTALNLKLLLEERHLDCKNEKEVVSPQIQKNSNSTTTASGNGANVNIVPAALSCSQGENEETEEENSLNIAARRTLFRLWEWIERIESLCSAEGGPSSIIDDLPSWPVKGLNDAGIVKLLRVELHESDDFHLYDKVFPSESLFCNTYDSPMRRAALTACGWKGRFNLKDILMECENMGNFERSAALAVWDGDLSEAVAALQRGADHIRTLVQEGNIDCNRPARLSTSQYAETLQLIAMCLAGYAPNGSSTTGVWRRACGGVLQRQDLSPKGRVTTHIHYLRAACNFLTCIGSTDGFQKILNDDMLSLSDRVAFACRFLPRRDLIAFLNYYMKKCMDTGNLEGLVITGLGKRGIYILQSYVDIYSDVQTAALVSSRISLPLDWVDERAICSEWLDSYREILNTWQMWQSRATFDVGRADLLRKLRMKHVEEMAANAVPPGGRQHHPVRRPGYGHVVPPSTSKRAYHHQSSSSSSKQDVESSIPIFPPQLYARCNYCNTTLPLSKLRRQEGIANSWLSRQKPILSCCPKCKKALPGCAICLLPMGCLNPYMELKRESNNSSRNLRGDDDLSGLANIPFAEWFTWCMRCKHGGHAHHMVGWFTNHDTCPVSDCDCKCQFDGIQKLARPALNKKCIEVPP